MRLEVELDRPIQIIDRNVEPNNLTANCLTPHFIFLSKRRLANKSTTQFTGSLAEWPGGSGDQLAAAIKTVAPRPVILMTGFGDIMDATGEKPAGVDMILTKPASLNALRGAVATVISDWEGTLGAQLGASVQP